MRQGLIRAPEAPGGFWRSGRAGGARCRDVGFAPVALHDGFTAGGRRGGTDSGNLTRRGDPCERALTPHTSAYCVVPKVTCQAPGKLSRNESNASKKVTPSLYWSKSYHFGGIELEMGVG